MDLSVNTLIMHSDNIILKGSYPAEKFNTLLEKLHSGVQIQ